MISTIAFVIESLIMLPSMQQAKSKGVASALPLLSFHYEFLAKHVMGINK